MKRLVEPRGLRIDFRPSQKQYLVWEHLQPNYCPKCHHEGLEMKRVGEDKFGNPIHKAVCSHCGNVNIPQQILIGGAAGGGKSMLISCFLISSCIRFPGIRAIVGRRTLKSLKESTWLTILQVLADWGLKQDEHFRINNVASTITFWNGSTILGMELSPSLQDPEYQRFGSLEATICGLDEVAEIPEKAVEVLYSRLRYMTAETFKVPKMVMSCNPTLQWPKRVFVMDDDGNPPHLDEGMFYIPFTLFDNPNKAFVQTYFNLLRKIRDKATRERLTYGNWDFVEANKMAAYWGFDGERHLNSRLFEEKYDPTKPIIISCDFNVSPWMVWIMVQVDYDNKRFYVFDEFVGKAEDKLNNTPALSRYVAKKLKSIGHINDIVVTGDPAGLARSTQTEEGVNNYTIIKDAMEAEGIKAKTSLLQKQPAQTTRLEFINKCFDNYDGWTVAIDLKCRRLTEDMIYQKKNPDGTKEKKKVLDENGNKSERYGHASDCFDYAMCYFLDRSYSKFKSGAVPIVTTIGDDTEMYDQFMY